LCKNTKNIFSLSFFVVFFIFMAVFGCALVGVLGGGYLHALVVRALELVPWWFVLGGGYLHTLELVPWWFVPWWWLPACLGACALVVGVSLCALAVGRLVVGGYLCALELVLCWLVCPCGSCPGWK